MFARTAPALAVAAAATATADAAAVEPEAHNFDEKNSGKLPFVKFLALWLGHWSKMKQY